MTDDKSTLAQHFEEHRRHLRAVAFRMLGSRSEADDAVQEAWLKISRADTETVENLGGFLTTVVARICLDALRSRRAHREDAGFERLPEPATDDVVDPEHELLLADSVGPALVVVLETLAPGERLAFVLHDLFGMSFEEIAPIVGRSETAVRQLASRGRRRVQGKPVEEVDRKAERQVIEAFLAASRRGDFDALVAVLDPSVVVRADATAQKIGAARELRGLEAVAKNFLAKAQGARLALVDGAPGATWAPGGKPKIAFDFTIENGKIVAVDLVGDQAWLEEVAIELLEPA